MAHVVLKQRHTDVFSLLFVARRNISERQTNLRPTDLCVLSLLESVVQLFAQIHERFVAPVQRANAHRHVPKDKFSSISIDRGSIGEHEIYKLLPCTNADYMYNATGR